VCIQTITRGQNEAGKREIGEEERKKYKTTLTTQKIELMMN
jgi:hypothetical protein